MGFGLIGTKVIVYLWYNMRTKTNLVGLGSIETIAGLGIFDAEAIVFLRKDMRSETNWWWHGFSGKVALLVRGMGAGRWPQQMDGKILWEEGGFGGPVWFVSMESYKEN